MKRGFSRFRSKRRKHKIDPVESLVNLIDIMLIFACGLMVSIVMLWNLEIATDSPVEEGDEGQSYQEIGQVYEDPETGKIYIVK